MTMSFTPTPTTAEGLPLRSALKSEDDGDRPSPAGGSTKAVQIAEPETETADEGDVQTVKQFPAGLGRRLSGKPPPTQLPTNSSRSSLSDASVARPADDSHTNPHHNTQRRQYYSEKLLAQVGDWLEHERKKEAARKKKPRRRKSKSPPQDPPRVEEGQNGTRPRADSIDSQSSEISFDRLQHILEESLSHLGMNSLPHFPPKLSRPRHRKGAGSRASLHRTASSDTEYLGEDAIVPSCDAWLDNSKTLAYGAGNVSTDNLDARAEKDREAWISFKNEIIRIAHTLRLKGWRRIPLESGETINVERLSGALTNAVYVVTPPKELPDEEGKRKPTKILLRVYGPQVEHLIDRENELKVLQRLARKKIGPRLLGTFQNGRFEQFFNAITLTPADLREADMSRHIAKRMRELHDGIDLLPHEKDAGPGVWKNWDAWQDNVERIITALDEQLENGVGSSQQDSVSYAWQSNGYVCGTPWAQFKDMVTKYRDYLTKCYKSTKDINKRLVFAHNDTQYGNILRVSPDDEKSPLLQPANKHKQLIVIDFEYAGANIPGNEFANHFTEWTYNYHDAVTPHLCNEKRYPSPEEQRRFIKAYIDHQPKSSAGSSTPRMTPVDSGTSSAAQTPTPSTSSNTIVDFMLDARVPPGGWNAIEKAREEATEQRIRELMDETRLWRPANSAMWVAWGLVQAKVPDPEAPGVEEVPEDFDYLSYAQDRAMFFWGDCIKMGLANMEDLPETMRDKVKIVDY